MSDASDHLVVDPAMRCALDRSSGGAQPAKPTPEAVAPGARSSAALLRAAALGAEAGMRSTMPLALLAVAAQQPQTPVARAVAAMGPLAVVRSQPALVICGLGCVGELVADVLPFVPSRLLPAPLAWRIVVGATAGATGARTARSNGGSAAVGALLGGITAVIGAVGGYSSRMYLSRRLHLPDALGAVAEDMLALGLGLLALRPSLFPAATTLGQRVPLPHAWGRETGG
jgi:uncharacterized membrane protein